MLSTWGHCTANGIIIGSIERTLSILTLTEFIPNANFRYFLLQWKRFFNFNNMKTILTISLLSVDQVGKTRKVAIGFFSPGLKKMIILVRYCNINTTKNLCQRVLKVLESFKNRMWWYYIYNILEIVHRTLLVTVGGTKGGSISSASSFSQLIDIKKSCALIEGLRPL